MAYGFTLRGVLTLGIRPYALLNTDSAVRYWFSVLKNSCMKSVPFVVSRSISCIAGLTVLVHDEMTT